MVKRNISVDEALRELEIPAEYHDSVREALIKENE